MSESNSSKMPNAKIPFRFYPLLCVAVGVILVLGVGWWTRPYWTPLAIRMGIVPTAEAAEHEHEGHADAEKETQLVKISKQAQKNISLKVGPVTLGVYEKSVSIPAIVTERQGRTKRTVAAPLTGIVHDIFATPGQAVNPGDPLFVLRLKDDELILAQSTFLTTLIALDVQKREVERLQPAIEAIPRNVILKPKYQIDKLQGQLLAQRQALLLHGLTKEQIDVIAEERHLLREFLITAPAPHDETRPNHLAKVHPRLTSGSRLTANLPRTPSPSQGGSPSGGSSSVGTWPSEESTTYLVSALPVQQGQLVQAGQRLVVLADYARLYISGDAFERDATAIVRAAENHWDITAVLEQDRSQVVEGLGIVYVASEIDSLARTLEFYVALPNEIIHKARLEHGRVYPTWRYKPGQRVELQVPVAKWENKLVVPVSAVARDGAERYVFVQNGDSFRRQPVHVLFRGPDSVVIANDGSVFPGTRIAMTGAHLLLMELKNQLGGGSGGGHAHHHHH